MLDGAIGGLQTAFFLMSSYLKSSTRKHLGSSVGKTQSQSYQSGLSTFSHAHMHTQSCYPCGVVHRLVTERKIHLHPACPACEQGVSIVNWLTLIFGRLTNLRRKASPKSPLSEEHFSSTGAHNWSCNWSPQQHILPRKIIWIHYSPLCPAVFIPTFHSTIYYQYLSLHLTSPPYPAISLHLWLLFPLLLLPHTSNSIKKKKHTEEIEWQTLERGHLTFCADIWVFVSLAGKHNDISSPHQQPQRKTHQRNRKVAWKNLPFSNLSLQITPWLL